jgi:hypothetical protein
MSEFMTRLCVEEVDEFAGIWQLTHPLVYRSDLLGRTLTVPGDFQTDFASVPRLPVVYLAAGGRGDRAAVVHDWLYSTQCVDRSTADKVLREALLASGYSDMLANAFYVAVRSFGESHWKLPNLPQSDAVSAAMRLEPAPA